MTANASILPVLWPALYALLNVPAITTTLGCAVYDHVPQPRPSGRYLVLVSPTEIPERCMGNLGSNTTFQVHIYTHSDDYEGAGLAQRILSAVIGILEPAVPALAGFAVDGILYENGFEGGDEDVEGVTYTQYIAIFRILARAA